MTAPGAERAAPGPGCCRKAAFTMHKRCFSCEWTIYGRDFYSGASHCTTRRAPVLGGAPGAADGMILFGVSTVFLFATIRCCRPLLQRLPGAPHMGGSRRLHKGARRGASSPFRATGAPGSKVKLNTA